MRNRTKERRPGDGEQMLVRLAVRGFVIEAESPDHRGDVENKLCARISELQKKHDESEIHIEIGAGGLLRRAGKLRGQPYDRG